MFIKYMSLKDKRSKYHFTLSESFLRTSKKPITLGLSKKKNKKLLLVIGLTE